MSGLVFFLRIEKNKSAIKNFTKNPNHKLQSDTFVRHSLLFCNEDSTRATIDKTCPTFGKLIGIPIFLEQFVYELSQVD